MGARHEPNSSHDDRVFDKCPRRNSLRGRFFVGTNDKEFRELEMSHWPLAISFLLVLRTLTLVTAQRDKRLLGVVRGS